MELGALLPEQAVHPYLNCGLCRHNAPLCSLNYRLHLYNAPLCNIMHYCHARCSQTGSVFVNGIHGQSKLTAQTRTWTRVITCACSYPSTFSQ